MFMDFLRLDGVIASIDPTSFVVCSVPPGNIPRNATFVRYNGGSFYTQDTIGQVVGKVAPHVPLIQLTDPRPSAIWLNAGAINAITPRIEWRDHPRANASLVLGGRAQAVVESPEAVKAAVASALPSRFVIW